jgi:hypothetical protein
MERRLFILANWCRRRSSRTRQQQQQEKLFHRFWECRVVPCRVISSYISFSCFSLVLNNLTNEWKNEAIPTMVWRQRDKLSTTLFILITHYYVPSNAHLTYINWNTKKREPPPRYTQLGFFLFVHESRFRSSVAAAARQPRARFPPSLLWLIINRIENRGRRRSRRGEVLKGKLSVCYTGPV